MGLYILIFIAIFSLIQENLAQCNFNFDDYSVSWILDRNNHIRFHLVKNRMIDNTWVAIAFGNSMPTGLDIIMLKVINGRVFITDESVNRRGPPFIDMSQDVRTQSSSYSNGMLQASFSRPVWATESFVDHHIHGCTPWNFITHGGIVHAYDHVGKHRMHPIRMVVCIEQCRI